MEVIRYWLKVLRARWRVGRRKFMQNISVGIRNDGTIDVDIEEEDSTKTISRGWSFHNLSQEEATFLRDELDFVIARSEKYKKREPDQVTPDGVTDLPPPIEPPPIEEA